MTDAQRHELELVIQRDTIRRLVDYTVEYAGKRMSAQHWEDLTWQTLGSALRFAMRAGEGTMSLKDIKDACPRGLADDEDAPQDVPETEAEVRSEAWADAYHDQWDDDPNPFHGTYSEE